MNYRSLFVSEILCSAFGGAILCAAEAATPAAGATSSSAAASAAAADNTPAWLRLDSQEHVPQWLGFSAEERGRMEVVTGNNYRPDTSDAYMLNRLRLNLQIKPSSWFKVNLQAQDARAWNYFMQPAPSSVKDSIDLRQASVEIGGGEDRRFGFQAGRQPLNFGEGRLVADPNWSNVGRTFDALRLTVREKGVRLDVFSGSPVQMVDGEFNGSGYGNTFYGVYAALDKLLPRFIVEPYFFSKLAHGVRAEGGQLGNQQVHTAGLRWLGKLSRRLDYGIEAARQVGSIAGDPISAWAEHWAVGYTLTDGSHQPRLFGEYNYASGDRDPKDGQRGTFDQLYPSAHDKFGLNDQVMWSNMHDAQSGLEFRVSSKLTMKGAYNSLWLAEAKDGLYRGGKLFVKVANGAAGRHIGEEVDLQGAFTLDRRTQVNAGYGRLFPGAYLMAATPGVPYNFVFLSLARKF
jgi:hypothetical protein